MSWLVNLIGFAAIAGVLWWFWLVPKSGSGAARKGIAVDENLEILVQDGVYEPDTVRIPANTPVTLNFRREDPSPCAEYVIFADLDVSAQLATHQITAVKIPTTDVGQYPFTCQMKMYRGTLIVE